MSRDQILSRVRSALAPLPQRAALPDWEAELIRLRTTRTTTAVDASAPADLWPLLTERLRAVNGLAFSTLADLVAYLVEQNCLHGYCDPTLYPKVRDAFPSTFTVETTFDRARLDDYKFGLTLAAGAIAETGTLILSDNTSSSRLGALAPWVHIAAISRADIHPDISAAIAAFPKDPNLVWVTGPSKTADVEGILIEGVHGPGLQAALLLA
jgi:L-lactate dehydrogenase complex protein LldG